jgi:hypothetical protein
MRELWTASFIERGSAEASRRTSSPPSARAWRGGRGVRPALAAGYGEIKSPQAMIVPAGSPFVDVATCTLTE